MTIRQRRKEKGLTQIDLAKLMNVNQTAVSQWERGIVMPRMKKCIKLARILECSVDEIFIQSNKGA